MSATLNAGSFRLDDTLYGVSRTLKSYLRSILMHKHGIRLIPKSVKPGSCLTPPCNRKLGRRVRNVARIFPNGKWPHGTGWLTMQSAANREINREFC